MHRDLLRPPLQQVLVLLWLIGCAQVLVSLVLRPVGGTWALSAALAGLLSVLVAGRLRRAWILSAGALAGLGSLWALTRPAALPAERVGDLAVLYGLALQVGVPGLLGRPTLARLLPLMGLAGGWGPEGGRRAAESALHWTCLALVLAGVLLPVLRSPAWGLDLARVGVPPGSLLGLAAGLVFMAVAARRYRRSLPVHLGMGLWVWLGLTLYALGLPHSGLAAVSPRDPLAGLLLGLMAWVALAAAYWAVRLGLGEGEGTAADRPGFLAGPLTAWALGLGVLTAVQCLILARADWTGPVSGALASSVLLAANRTWREPALTLAGAALGGLSLCWGYSLAVYGVLPFDLWPGGPAGADRWLLLASLAVALAFLARWREGDPDWQRVQTEPLLALAWALVVWSLAGALALLPAAGEGSLPLALVWAAAGLGVFPLLGRAPGAAWWRGLALALLATLLAASLLGPALLLRWGPTGLVAWAYVLWLLGNLGLPRLERRLARWPVDWASWSWVGLALFCAGAVLDWPGVLWDWSATLSAAGYLALLSRNTRAPILWGATALCAWTLAVQSGPGAGSVGLWLAVAVPSLGLAALGRLLARAPDRQGRFARPVLGLAWFGWGWGLRGVLMLLAGADGSSPGLALALVLAALGLFPLLGPDPAAGRWRGVALAPLASLIPAALVGWGALLAGGAALALAWGYALWALGTLVLPRLGRRWPNWAVDGTAWPWMGLVPVGLGVYLAGLAPWSGATAGLAAAVYLLLLAGGTWLPIEWAAVAALVWVGALGSGLATLPTVEGLWPRQPGLAVAANLLWSNLLLLLVPVWGRWGAGVAERLGLRPLPLRWPLILGGLLPLLFWTLALALWTLSMALSPILPLAPWARAGGFALPGALLLPPTWLKLLWQWRSPLAAHLLVLGTLVALLALWALVRPCGLALALALWCVGLVGLAAWLGGRAHWLARLVGPAVERWLVPSLGVAVALLAAPRTGTLGERLLALALASGVAAFSGWRTGSRAWLAVGLGLGLSLIHALWLPWVGWGRWPDLLPLYALQSALLAALALWAGRLAGRGGAGEGAESAPLSRSVLALLGRGLPWVMALAVLEWLGAGLLALLHASAKAPVASGPAAGAAYAAASAVLVGLCLDRARRDGQAGWVYAAAALAGGAGLYLRLLWVGLAPATPWDTAALMVAAYALFLVGRLALSRPALQVTLVLPLLALATVPMQLGSAQSALTLLAAGALYLLTRATLRTQTPLYLGLLSINAAIYLWVPDWSRRFGVLQIYLIPAALTVLLLLHLHRRELKRRVLHAARLGTLAVLYAAATLDVFLVSSLQVFVLALGVGLGAILLGIGLRIRAFLYSGVAFLVLNVAGQLILLYPEDRLGKALVLMGLGAAITGGMLWVNLQRERIMQRIRVFRADLAEWE